MSLMVELTCVNTRYKFLYNIPPVHKPPFTLYRSREYEQLLQLIAELTVLNTTV